MTAQTTLTEDAPLILDATCSSERIWPRYATVRIDIRPEVHPDIVMDNTKLQFADASIGIIYYDPPHVIRRTQDLKWMQHFKELRRKNGRTSPSFFERFGYWESKAAFIQNLDGVNKEFYRCLKPTGELRCKISVESGHKTRCITVEEFFAHMNNFILVKDKTSKSKSNLGKNVVHWLVMKPKPCQK